MQQFVCECTPHWPLACAAIESINECVVLLKLDLLLGCHVSDHIANALIKCDMLLFYAYSMEMVQ